MAASPTLKQVKMEPSSLGLVAAPPAAAPKKRSRVEGLAIQKLIYAARDTCKCGMRLARDSQAKEEQWMCERILTDNQPTDECQVVKKSTLVLAEGDARLFKAKDADED